MIRASLWCLSLAVLLAGCGNDKENATDRAADVAIEATAGPPAKAAEAPAPAAPPAVQQGIETLARDFDTEGEVGVAVRDLGAGWTASWRGGDRFPQQSVVKIWLAVAVLDAVDRGELSLDEAMVVRPEDLSLFNQPIRAMVVRDGEFRTTLGDLLRRSLANSDNAATDILFRRLGGGEEVQKVLDSKRLRGISVGVQERVLQPRISGLRWRPEYSDPEAFKVARDAVPPETRESALKAYLANPMDGATPLGTVHALQALKEGRLLSQASTEHLLRIMFESRAGAARLKAGLPEGWAISHKTGTGPDYRGRTAGYNDVGLLVAPDGHAYAVAVYLGDTGKPLRERQRMMAEVARTLVTHWEQTRVPQLPAAGEPSNVPGPR